MDVENSMVNSSFATEKSVPVAKGGNVGLMAYAKGNRRFRIAMCICCLLHVVLVGLIIAFVIRANDDDYNAGSSSASIAQGQISTKAPSGNDSKDLVTATTLAPDPDLYDQLASSAENNVVSNATSIPPINTFEQENTTEEEPKEEVAEEEPKEEVAEEETAFGVGQGEQIPADDTAPGSCADTMEVSLACVGVGSELLAYFESCTPQVGDWVGIFESSEDANFLLDENTIAWMYTCGDRTCEEAMAKEVLSFARMTELAGIGTFRAHLIRGGGEGAFYSSIASSADFSIVDDADTSC